MAGNGDRGPSRIQAARRRGHAAKLAAALVGGSAFVLLLPLVRAHHAGKPLPQSTPLAAPQSFVADVRANLLQAGMIAPPQQAPQVSSSVS